jgi:hypothetical protein
MFFSYYILACFFVGIASRAGSLEGDFEFGCFMWVTIISSGLLPGNDVEFGAR